MGFLVSLAWRLSLNIMKFGVSFLNSEPTGPTVRTPRRRPLHTCGASFLTIAQIACSKLQALDGPLGSTATRAISFMNSFYPFVYFVLYPFLALLSSVDDHILTSESKLEAIFPPSTRLFDKIDALVCSAETLPEHVDDMFNKIPLIMHRLPFLDWVLVRVISQLNYILSVLTHLGSKNTSEKEISIDVVNSNDVRIREPEQSEEKSLASVDQSDISNKNRNDISNNNRDETSNDVMDLEELVKSYTSHDLCNATRREHIEPSKAMTCEVIQKSVDRLRFLRNRIKILEDPHFADSPMYTSYQSANSSPVSDCSEGEISPGKSDHFMNCSYKEMLERGVNEEKAEIAEMVGKNSNEGSVKSTF